MTLPKEGIPRPKIPRNFPAVLVVAACSVLTFPHEVKAKLTIVDGGTDGAPFAGGASGSGGSGGNSSISWITLHPGIPYTFVIGASGSPGGQSSFTAKNSVPITSANGQINVQGGSGFSAPGGSTAGQGGASIYATNSSGNGHGIGGGGAGSSTSTVFTGTSGAIILEFSNGF